MDSKKKTNQLDSYSRALQAVVDFYNLKLTSGRVYAPYSVNKPYGFRFNRSGGGIRVKAVVPPDDNERQRILGFLKKYTPQVFAAYHQKVQELDPDSVMPLDASERYYPIGTLEAYEVTRRVRWFESKDFLDFVDHWRNLRGLLDGIITRQLDLELLAWFFRYGIQWHAKGESEFVKSDGTRLGRNITKGYQLSLDLIAPDGKRVDPGKLVFDGEAEAVPLGEWRIQKSSQFEAARYGIHINSILAPIHRICVDLMETPEKDAIRKCPLDCCGRIFAVPNKNKGRPPRFCSDLCQQSYKSEYDNLTMKYRARPRREGKPQKSLEWINREALKRCRSKG